MSKDWWETTRREAYRKNNYHCHACAGSPDDDPFKSQLEAHECYDIEWGDARATYVETVALCWSCHNFIHSGRLRALVDEGKEDEKTLRHVLTHGMSILQQEDLLPYWRTWCIAKECLDNQMVSVTVRKARELDIVHLYDAMRMPAKLWTIKIYDIVYRRNEHEKFTAT